MKKKKTCLKKKKRYFRDFPGGPVAKNPPCNAAVTGSIPGQGTKISHAMEQLSLRVATTETVCQSLSTTTRESVHLNKRSCTTQQRACVPNKYFF